MLEEAARHHGFELQRMPTISHEGERVSSSRVRRSLAAGDMAMTEALLGRRLSISGRVVRGQALGRQLGWPTANLRFGHQSPPMRGIFNVLVHGLADQPWPGVASLGTRPTVNGVETLLETYLLDFSGDIYGRTISVELLEWQRPETDFKGLDALSEQIAADVASARQWFQTQGYTIPDRAG